MESVVHNDVCILELSNYAIIPGFEVRLARQIAGKQQPGTNSVLIEVLKQINPEYLRLIPQREWEAAVRTRR